MPNIVVDPDGKIRLIYTDDLKFLLNEGASEIRRVSHVEPDARGDWFADMGPVGGPILGPYPLRQQALDAEVAWLNANQL